MGYQDLPPAPPDHLPETPEFSRRSRYQRPRRSILWWVVMIGLVAGLAGGLYYAWEVNPVIEVDTLPRQLRVEDKRHFVVAITLSFRQNGDLDTALERLIELELGPDPFQAVADYACDLARSNYISTSSGLNAVRAMKTFYQLQGKAGCADTLIPDVDEDSDPIVQIEAPTLTPTLPPPPSKTPTQSGPRMTNTPVVAPTVPPRRDFTAQFINSFCDVELSGIIEVRVIDFNGRPVPGERMRVRWDEGDDTFVTGLKPERGLDYADFRMAPGKGYTIDMPGRADPLGQALVADTCVTEGGIEAITSYRIAFRQTG